MTNRGAQFETHIGQMLDAVTQKHPGLVEIRRQPELRLLSGSIKRPDFELVYRLEQEHRELIEVQSREHSSPDLAAKIKLIKSLSSRNRFVFVFEHFDALSPSHRRELEDDGVQCLGPDEFDRKLQQLDAVLAAIEAAVAGGLPNLAVRKVRFSDVMRTLLRARGTLLGDEAERVFGDATRIGRDRTIFRGPS